jgi:predicted outer membrane repeat protein
MAKMVVNYAVNVLGISPEMGITPPSLRDTSPAVLREGKIRNLSITQEDKESENNETPIFLSRSTAGVAEGGGAINAEGVIDTNKIPPTPLYERGNCTFSDIANQTQELQTYITQACQL